MDETLNQIVRLLNVPAQYQGVLSLSLSLLLFALLAVLAHYLAKLVVTRGLEKALLASENRRDDKFVKHKVFRRLVHLVPALVMYSMAKTLGERYAGLSEFISTACLLYMVLMITLFLDALINALLEIFQSFELSRHIPLKSFAQVIKLILYFVCTIALISLIIGESPMRLIAGLGAMTAVLMLVFKDPILGFVAGLQLSSNRMVARGDWIEIPSYGVDGDVMDIALTTVKIRNFDKTITTVPTQALINESFKNWRGMQESGGRRIKRAINIDISSVKFCSEEMLQRYSKISYISEYIASKQEELQAHNSDASIDYYALANGRRLTNLGTFRAYVIAYLRNRPDISQDLTFLVRQLKPTETGVPIEVYVFSKEQRWIEYEGIQADIFDHILAVVHEFDLRVFQNSSDSAFAVLQTAEAE